MLMLTCTMYSSGHLVRVVLFWQTWHPQVPPVLDRCRLQPALVADHVVFSQVASGRAPQGDECRSDDEPAKVESAPCGGPARCVCRT
eukprot:1477090-Amphidinium_carterae.1